MIVGQYEIGKQIGSGSFSHVHLGIHTITRKEVAVKIFSREKIRELHLGEKIDREIRVLKLFRHPHIIRLYEVIDTEKHIYMFLEYISGGELFDYIVSQSVSESVARSFFQQMISAVDYCHKHQVVHRDLKPENLFLNSQNSIKLGDFGLSNIMADGDFLQTSCGSPNYAAPEVVSGKHYIGPQIDVWSCGIILYALLTGSLPFDDYKLATLFAKIKNANYRMLSCIPAPAQDLIRRMLVVDPMERITVEEIKRHPWFRTNLPVYIDHLLEARVEPDIIDPDPAIVGQLAQYGFSAEELHEAIRNKDLESKVLVAYHLLTDLKESSATEEPTCAHPFRDRVFSTYVPLNACLTQPNPPSPDTLGCEAVDELLVIPRSFDPHARPPPVATPAPTRPQTPTPAPAQAPDLANNGPTPLKVPTLPPQLPNDHLAFVLGFAVCAADTVSPHNFMLLLLAVLQGQGYVWKHGKSVLRVDSIEELRIDHNTNEPFTAPVAMVMPEQIDGPRPPENSAGDMIPDSTKIGLMNGGAPAKKKRRHQPSEYQLRFRLRSDAEHLAAHPELQPAHQELRFGLTLYVVPETPTEGPRYLIDLKRLYGETLLFLQRCRHLMQVLVDPDTIHAAAEEVGISLPAGFATALSDPLSPRQARLGASLRTGQEG